MVKYINKKILKKFTIAQISIIRSGCEIPSLYYETLINTGKNNPIKG
jgi:hypothetical protein